MHPTTESMLNEGWKSFYASNLPQAELFCREHIRLNPTDYGAFRLLESITYQYQLPQGFSICEKPDSTLGRYLLIKAWGYGFWSEGHHLASQLLLAELTNRTPIILWGTNCLFSADNDVNAIDHFFDGLSKHTIAEIPESRCTEMGRRLFTDGSTILVQQRRDRRGKRLFLHNQFNHSMDQPELFLLSQE